MKTKCAVVAILIALAFASQASAVLRPLFPIKPSAPFNGEFIVIGDGFRAAIHEKACHASPGPSTVASAWTEGYRPRDNSCPFAAYAKISRARDAASIETHE